jgi:hypothetical protein
MLFSGFLKKKTISRTIESIVVLSLHGRTRDLITVSEARSSRSRTRRNSRRLIPRPGNDARRLLRHSPGAPGVTVPYRTQLLDSSHNHESNSCVQNPSPGSRGLMGNPGSLSWRRLVSAALIYSLLARTPEQFGPVKVQSLPLALAMRPPPWSTTPPPP